jgi:hypothetical protein
MSLFADASRFCHTATNLTSNYAFSTPNTLQNTTTTFVPNSLSTVVIDVTSMLTNRDGPISIRFSKTGSNVGIAFSTMELIFEIDSVRMHTKSSRMRKKDERKKKKQTNKQTN